MEPVDPTTPSLSNRMVLTDSRTKWPNGLALKFRFFSVRTEVFFFAASIIHVPFFCCILGCLHFLRAALNHVCADDHLPPCMTSYIRQPNLLLFLAQMPASTPTSTSASAPARPAIKPASQLCKAVEAILALPRLASRYGIFGIFAGPHTVRGRWPLYCVRHADRATLPVAYCRVRRAFTESLPVRREVSVS